MSDAAPLTNEYTPEALPPDLASVLDAYVQSLKSLDLSIALTREGLAHLKGSDLPPQIIRELKDIHSSAALMLDHICEMFNVKSEHFRQSISEWSHFPKTDIN